jgi:hypothetical protein
MKFLISILGILFLNALAAQGNKQSDSAHYTRFIAMAGVTGLLSEGETSLATGLGAFAGINKFQAGAIVIGQLNKYQNDFMLAAVGGIRLSNRSLYKVVSIGYGRQFGHTIETIQLPPGWGGYGKTAVDKQWHGVYLQVEIVKPLKNSAVGGFFSFMVGDDFTAVHFGLNVMLGEYYQ